MTWVAYIDESGDDDADDAFFVGGLLMPEKFGFESVWAAAKLMTAAPEMPWPPHARLYNRLSPWFLWSNRHPALVTLPCNAVREALGRFERLERASLQAAQMLLEDGREPRDEDLAALDRCIHQEPNLRHLAERRRQAFYSELGEVLSRAGEQGAVAFGILNGPDRSRGERYLRLLGGALARAMQLADRHESLRLESEILKRHVENATLGRRAMLRKDDVFAAARNATGSVGVAQVGRCRLIGVDLHNWDDTTGVALVLADFVANQLRWFLSQELDLPTVRRRVRAKIALDVLLQQWPTVHQEGPPFDRPWARESYAMREG